MLSMQGKMGDLKRRLLFLLGFTDHENAGHYGVEEHLYTARLAAETGLPTLWMHRRAHPGMPSAMRLALAVLGLRAENDRSGPDTMSCFTDGSFGPIGDVVANPSVDFTIP